jgi:hypothetical protein
MSITECRLPGAYDGGTYGGCDDNWSDLHKSAGSCTTLNQTITYPTVERTETYQSNCPSATKVQWTFLTYATTQQSNTSGSTSTSFSVQSAPLLSDGGAGTFVGGSDGGASTVADTAAGDPATCRLSDSPACSRSIATALGAINSQNEVLKLTIRMVPTPDGTLAPTVTSWNVAYSCPPAE